jgi:hypothetical protein
MNRDFFRYAGYSQIVDETQIHIEIYDPFVNIDFYTYQKYPMTQGGFMVFKQRDLYLFKQAY